MKKTALLLTLLAFLTGSVSAADDTVKWVDFSATCVVMKEASRVDIGTYGTDSHRDWIALISLMACENGNDFSNCTSVDVENVSEDYENLLNKWSGKKIYKYYYKSYSAVLSGLLGKGIIEKRNEDGTVTQEDFYGICAVSPIAGGYYYNHYDDFGASRSFGYRRKHLGHDLMCSVGTPVVAVEGGFVETCGWNVYGGWRIGIRSFDSKRYYYYAHLRKGHPYNDIYVGKTVAAGEVIGFAGMTGYSSKEDVNNINVPHLHIGEELIFSPEQKDGYCQIWIDMYELTEFLAESRSFSLFSEVNDKVESSVKIYGPDFPD